MHKPMTKPQTQMFWRLFAKSCLMQDSANVGGCLRLLRSVELHDLECQHGDEMGHATLVAGVLLVEAPADPRLPFRVHVA